MPPSGAGRTDPLSPAERLAEVWGAHAHLTEHDGRTALHVAAGLRLRSPAVLVTRLASGLPVGSDLEYADEVTLGRAFEGRRLLDV